MDPARGPAGFSEPDVAVLRDVSSVLEGHCPVCSMPPHGFWAMKSHYGQSWDLIAVACLQEMWEPSLAVVEGSGEFSRPAQALYGRGIPAKKAC